MANHGGNNSSSSNDHCWPSKMQVEEIIFKNMDSNSMANHGGNNSSSSHDHCWPSKMQDWHLKSPWD